MLEVATCADIGGITGRFGRLFHISLFMAYNSSVLEDGRLAHTVTMERRRIISAAPPAAVLSDKYTRVTTG